MKKTKFLNPLLAFLILLTLSCGQRNKNNPDAFKYSDEKLMEELELTKAFIYAFPSPGDLLQRIGEANLSYNKEMLHSTSDGKRYLTTRGKALNLGIYTADLAYAAMFSRTSEAIEYLDVVRSLGQDINVSTSAYESLADRALENIGNTDSLRDISNDLFFEMVEFLEISGQTNTIALVSAGAYIESMHIALQSVDHYSQENEIISQIVELKYPLRNLLDHAESVSEDPNVKSILKYIQDLNNTFNELAKESGVGDVLKEEPGVITINGEEEEIMNEESFLTLKAKVKELRHFIISIEE